MKINEKKEKYQQVDKNFYNKMASICLNNDLHIATVYKLCFIPHISEMLNNMFEATIKEYKLHELTVNRLLNNEELRYFIEKEICRKVKNVKLL